MTRKRTVETPSDAVAGQAVPAPAAAKRETHHEVRANTGDPRYREATRIALTDWRKVQGLEAPETTLVVGPPPCDNGMLSQPDVSRLSLEQMETLVHLLDLMWGGHGTGDPRALPAPDAEIREITPAGAQASAAHGGGGLPHGHGDSRRG